MTEIETLSSILKALKNKDLSVLNIENATFINDVTMVLLDKEEHDQKDIIKIGIIVCISNILYNNTAIEVLPLEDGIYDLLLTLYKKYNPFYQVGAEPVEFSSDFDKCCSFDNNEEAKPLVSPIKYITKEDMLYVDDISKVPEPNRLDFAVRPIIYDAVGSKKYKNTAHIYPKLVGTLDKCKFVLNAQAAERGVLDNDNIEIFERDFIQKHIASGILDPDRKFYMTAELKYDGISVEAQVSDRILSARSRGDTNNNVATDMTNIFYNKIFHRAVGKVSPDNVFGMKFEAIITYENMRKLNELYGKNYKNPRNAVIGLTSSLDAANYADFITLIPLATSIEEIDRLTEIQFLNKYYNTGELLRYSVLYGNYKEILFQVKHFVEEAEYMRSFLPFMYDGVVLTYVESDLQDKLGRVNSVNKYSVAIKFNALKKQTIFTGYTYSVGQNGVITPMINYNPIEFYGGIHTKSSGHSYKRFLDLGLKLGDVISVEFTNDVMPYVTKMDIDANYNNPNEVIAFIEECPSCGNKLKISDSGKSVICDNIECPERNLMRMVNMLQKLNLKDFSEESLKSIAKFSLTDLLNLTVDDIKFIGETNSETFIKRMNQLKEMPLYDYRILGALGFSSIAIEKWKLILNAISIDQLIHLPSEELYSVLVAIKGIGPIAADTIITEREFYIDDIITISKMKNIVPTKGMTSGKVIRFSGIRDQELVDTVSALGHDISSTAGVTKSTDILLIPNASYTSEKTKKVGPETLIIPIQEFKENLNSYL